MFCLDSAYCAFPFAANLFVQLGYPYEPGGEMSAEDDEQILSDLHAVAEYGASLTALHGFVYTDDLVEFFDNNAPDIYAYLLDWEDDFFEESLAGDFDLTRDEVEAVENMTPSMTTKEKIVLRLLEIVAGYVQYEAN